MSDLSELYQQVILDHNQKPRNFHALDGGARRADGHNPLCGDRLTLYLDVQGGVVRDVGFQGSGCAISKASASMMTDAVKGHTEEEAAALFRLFHDLVTGAPGAADDDPRLGKLVVFAGVRDYPVRVKCATLAWHTLRAALDNGGAVASTE
ncbi:MAG TPA: SUF system NifU family Fe-S cluster assembly protein [Candidatus Polarisedimenticolia bacterium]|nr:SUF system NifU family Fe-S cluster assembly protein [Candidatus Polarisedimenticolia bacterium]